MVKLSREKLHSCEAKSLFTLSVVGVVIKTEKKSFMHAYCKTFMDS